MPDLCTIVTEYGDVVEIAVVKYALPFTVFSLPRARVTIATLLRLSIIYLDRFSFCGRGANFRDTPMPGLMKYISSWEKALVIFDIALQEV